MRRVRPDPGLRIAYWLPAGQRHVDARPGLENERLQAELLAQLEELRASRARFVQTAGAEHRGLERNLHDGAQQRLLALSYDIRLARAAHERTGTPQPRWPWPGRPWKLKTCWGIADLAHGIYPAVLAEGG